MSRRSTAPSRRKEVIEGDAAAASPHKRARHLKPDPLDLVALDRAQGGLTDPDQDSRRPLRKSIIRPPLRNLLPNAHGASVSDSDSSHYPTKQADPPKAAPTCDSNSFQYASNMANEQKKQSKRASSAPPSRGSRKPKSGSFARAAPAIAEAYEKPERKRGKNTITDDQMRAVQAFLTRWVARHCMGRDGKKYGQRAIADTLGITQNEYSNWMNDVARPGLPRLIRLREKTGASIEEILGL